MGSKLSAKLGGVHKLIALDPASGFNYRLSSFQESKAKTTRCFVGEDSEAGDEKLASTCDKKYIIDYHNKLSVKEEHSAVVEDYRKIISDNYFGYNNYLKLNNNLDNFNNSFYRILTKNKFNGIIDVLVSDNKERKINFLKTQKDDNSYIFFGTKADNIFKCSEFKQNCYFEGYLGQDSFIINGYSENKNTDSYIIDLAQGDSGDKIKISKMFLKSILKPIQHKNYVEIPIQYYFTSRTDLGYYTKSIFIKGVSKDEVEE